MSTYHLKPNLCPGTHSVVRVLLLCTTGIGAGTLSGVFLSTVSMVYAYDGGCSLLTNYSCSSPSCFEPADPPALHVRPLPNPSYRATWSSSAPEPVLTGKLPCSWLARSATMEQSAGRSCGRTAPVVRKRGIATDRPKSPASDERRSPSPAWISAGGGIVPNVSCLETGKRQADNCEFTLYSLPVVSSTDYSQPAVTRYATNSLGRSPPVSVSKYLSVARTFHGTRNESGALNPRQMVTDLTSLILPPFGATFQPY